MKKIPMIAIVDDDESCRMALSSLVRSIGYEPRLYPNAEALLASPGLSHTDCLITDVHMPGMDGLELLAALANDRHAIPSIVITAYPKPSVRERAQSVGADYFLSKPYNVGTIIQCLETIIDRQSGTSAAEME